MKLIGFSVAIVLFLCSFLFFAGAVNAVTNVSACGQAINVAGGYYVLNRSINSSSTCLTIGANNVTLDCAYYGTQYNLTGTLAENTYGVYMTGKTNVTIKNCLITSFESGVYATSSSNNGVYLNNTANNNLAYGFVLSSSSNNSHVNNTANNNYYGFELYSSHNNSLVNNTANNNDYAGFDVYLFSDNNSFANNTATKASGHSGFAFSGLSYSDFQNHVDSSNTVNGSPVKYYDGVQTPCPNDTVLSLGSSYSLIVFVGCNNVTLTNTTATDGIALFYTTNSAVTNSDSCSSAHGFYLSASSNNAFVNNTANDNGFEGFYLESSSNNNSFVNNTVNDNNYPGFAFYSSSNNSLVNNTANNNGWFGFDLEFSSDNNSFANNTVNDNGRNGFSLSASSNNTLTGNRIAASGADSVGIYIGSDYTGAGSNYSVVSGNAVSTTGSGASYAVYFQDSYWNVLSDGIFNSSYAGVADVYVEGYGINNFTNCTFNKSDTAFAGGANGGINVFWYADVRITDANGNGLVNAAINASNVNGTGVFNSTTNATGWIARRTVLEYYQNRTQTINYTPHWFNASLGAYSNNSQSGVSGNVALNRVLGLTRSASLDSPADGTTSTSYSQVFCFTPVTPGSPVNASVVVNSPSYYYSAGNSSGLVSGLQYCFDAVSLPVVGTYYWSVLFYDSYNYIQTNNFSLTVYNAFVGGGGGSTPTPAPTVIATPTVTVEPTLAPTEGANTPEGTVTPFLNASPTGRPTAASSATPSILNGAVAASQASAESALARANELLSEANAEEAESSEARDLLALAQQALQNGDYAEAQRYAQQAESILNSQISAATTSSSNAGFDWTLFAIIALMVLVAGAAYWFYSRHGKHG